MTRTKSTFCVTALVLVSLLGGACSEGGLVGPDAVAPPTMAAYARSPETATACVTPATTVVSTEAALTEAVDNAAPGDVIAISGVVNLQSYLWVWRPGVTLTCAAPGDGLRAAWTGLLPGWVVHSDMIYITNRDVAVQGLLLEGGVAFVLRAYRSTGISATTSNLRLVGNTIRCRDACVFIIGVPDALITDNHLISNTGGTGIHIQQAVSATGELYADNARVERNLIVALQPPRAPNYHGGVRARGGSDMVIRDNEIRGPWSNGISVADSWGSVIERNTISGVGTYGIFMGSNAFGPKTVTGVLVRGNTASAGSSGILVNSSCGNILVGNRLTAGAGAPRVFFTSLSGKNVLLGESSTSVDNGELDCDGDGTVDPNFLSGPGRKAANPGEVMGPVMQHANGTI